MRADFIRKTGPKTLKLVSGAAALLPSLENGKEVKAAKRLFTEINKEKWTNRILHVALIGLTILGVSALVAGTLSTGGAMSIVIAAAFLVVSLAMVAINGYFLYQALQSGSFDTKDKVMFIFSTTLLMSSATIGIIATGGVVPIVMCTIMGGLWIVIAGYSYMKWNHPPTKIIPQAD